MRGASFLKGLPMSQICSACNGTKKVHGRTCGKCGGTGRVEDDDDEDVVSTVVKAVGDVVEAAGDILDPDLL